MRYNTELRGIPGNTVRYDSTDVAQSFNIVDYTRNGKLAVSALITCETRNVRCAFGGVVPTQGAAAVGNVIVAGLGLILSNPYAISSFSFINATVGQNGVLQVTFEFEVGS